MRLSRVVGSTLLVAATLMLFPTIAHAWTPATHIFLGESVLANLAQLPVSVADLLRAFPYDFLYGSIAADTSIAKKYAPVGRHCHSWHVGQEIHDRAETDGLRVFALGYLAHLAADTVAHNFFVPRQLVITSSTIAMGHAYWESRFETHLGEHYSRRAMDIIRLDHTSADAHLDRILAPTIFSVRTSRRLFRGMVGITGTQRWKRDFQLMAERSRWDVTTGTVERHMGISFQLVMELLSDGSGMVKKLDPAGEASLNLAKRMRLDVMRSRLPNDVHRLSVLAEEHFGLPRYQLAFWETSGAQRPWEGKVGPGHDREPQVSSQSRSRPA